MKYPKQIDQKNYMGKPCWFTGEYCRTYGKEIVTYKVNPCFDTYKYPISKISVKWRIQSHLKQVGWIVGFGFVFNGTLHIHRHTSGDAKFFKSSKRVNYVRVRVYPQGPELKIPLSKIKLRKE